MGKKVPQSVKLLDGRVVDNLPTKLNNDTITNVSFSILI